MSQIVTRKGPVGEDKDKRQAESPVKEMKKKIAANAEKEKLAADKAVDKSVHIDKKSEKASEKIDKPDKTVDKSDKKEKCDKLDKSLDKKEKAEKNTDKKESDKKEHVESKEKVADKKEKIAEKKEIEEKKDEGKSNKEKEAKAEADDKSKKAEPKAKENGAKVNGEQNGDTVSSEDELQDLDVERDEMFPELAYEDSDGECFEPPTPEGLPSRSYTRRSQVKATRTPETPRPASEKHADRDYVPDESKLLKLKEDIPASDRKLRSADSPKPQDRKSERVPEASQSVGSPSVVLVPLVVVEETTTPEEDEKDKASKETNDVDEKAETEVESVVEVDNEDEGRVKADTNYSKSRVKVSPYRRSARLADHTDTSMLANYTGNNTTMEMDITETSSFISEEPYTDSPYLSGLRSIRGRRSYKPLKEMTLRNIGLNRSTRSSTSVNITEHPTRPTGTVVGRKRKPSNEDSMEIHPEVEEAVRSKRVRLLERLSKPFRMVSTPLPARRAAEIVGINTDLPLSAPVVSMETFDPEAIKAPTSTPIDIPNPTSNPIATERDSKRCVVM